MNELLIAASWISLVAALGFFLSGAVGLLRFPDLFCRLHAVTKADTMGFGLTTLALVLRADSAQDVIVLVLIWLLVMASGATNCQLLARYGQSPLQLQEDKLLQKDTLQRRSS